MAYIRGANPIWYMVDHIGQPLNDEYYAFFLSNTFPYTPQIPARDPNGLTFWTGGIVQFQPSGTLPNNLYFDDNLTYRIEIRRGNTQADELIWEINNYQPSSQSVTPDSNLSLTSSNQASNPQFSYVSFNETAVITTSGDHEVAPGWFLELTGAGTLTVTQIRTLSGSNNIPGNPAYALQLNISGWTTAYLRQRFEQNGSLFAGTDALNPSGITMSVTARSNDNIQHPLRLLYRQQGQTAVEVANGNLNITDYDIIDGAVQLDLSANNTVNPNSYTDMLVELPVNSSDITITNLQVIGEFIESTPVSLPFEQEPVERQLDHLFHYYHDSIMLQPKESILTGWNFALNPWQFRTTAQTNVANNTYTADQTIVIQQAYVNSATANNISVGRATYANNYAFKVTAVTATSQFAICQYVSAQTARRYWGKKVSALVKAKIATTNSTTARFKMRLIYRSTAVPTISQTEPVGTWTAGSSPNFSGGWTSIEPLNDPTYTLSSIADGVAFNSFTLPAATSDDMVFGIVLYLLDPLIQTGTPDSVYFEDISLVENDFAIESQVETEDETLRKCQFYYEKSYDTATLPGAANTYAGSQTISFPVTSDGSSSVAFMQKFDIKYKQTKNSSSPTIHLYSYAGTIDNISIGVDKYDATVVQAIADRAATQFTQHSITHDIASYYPNNTATSIYSVGAVHIDYLAYMLIHYVVDARLGI